MLKYKYYLSIKLSRQREHIQSVYFAHTNTTLII